MSIRSLRRQLTTARKLYKDLRRRKHWARAAYLKKWIKTHVELMKA